MSAPIGTTELAKLLGVNPATVRRWAADGWLPFEYKTRGGYYRFDLEAVRKVLGSHPHPQEEK